MQLIIIPLVNVNDKYYLYCHIVYYITSLLSYYVSLGSEFRVMVSVTMFSSFVPPVVCKRAY